MSPQVVANMLHSTMTTKRVKLEEQEQAPTTTDTVFSEKKDSLPDGEHSIHIQGGDSVNTYYLKRGSGYPRRHEAAMLDSARSAMTLNKDLSPDTYSPMRKINAYLQFNKTPVRGYEN